MSASLVGSEMCIRDRSTIERFVNNHEGPQQAHKANIASYILQISHCLLELSLYMPDWRERKLVTG
eukprot:9624911-Alexandrium_andersonii.AAC.1